MKTYIITTGIIFALVVGAHVWRAVEEGMSVAHSPLFVVSTIIGIALCVWAWRLVRCAPRS
jgi:hypothetical protein